MRRLTILSAKDRVVSMAVAIVLAPLLDPCSSDNVCAQRLVRERSSRRWLSHRSLENKVREGWDEKDWYAHFSEAGRHWIEAGGYRHVSVTDVSAYAENIFHDRLLYLIRKKVRDPRLLDFLTRLLRGWGRPGLSRTSVGLPQTYDLSHLLANLYLSPLDKVLLQQERSGRLRYVRFMDDIWTFSRTRAQAERVQRQISDILESMRLSANAKKTKIYRPRKFCRSSIGERRPVFRTLRHRDFALYMAGQAISLMGSLDPAGGGRLAPFSPDPVPLFPGPVRVLRPNSHLLFRFLVGRAL